MLFFIRFTVGLIIAFAAGVLWRPDQLAFAHPHAFIEERVAYEFDHKGLVGIQMTWTFDDMFAAMVAGEFDTNNSGSLEPEEVVKVKQGMFDNLINYSY